MERSGREEPSPEGGEESGAGGFRPGPASVGKPSRARGDGPAGWEEERAGAAQVRGKLLTGTARRGCAPMGVHRRRSGQDKGTGHNLSRASLRSMGRKALACVDPDSLEAFVPSIEPSVGSVGDSFDNALAETINGLYKAEVIHRRGPWRSFEAVEFATLEWVDWFNHRRLLEPIGNVPPAEAEARYYAQREVPARAA